MAVKIDRKLNLVVPIESDGKIIYVHSMPVSKQVFESNFLVMAKTFSRIHSEGLGAIGGPRIAAFMLKQVATDMGEEAAEAVEKGLMNEIRRLTNVVMIGASGWETVPFVEAVAKKLISEEDVAEVENAMVFFTVASAMYRREQRQVMLTGAARLWGAQIESLNCTEFATSLRTLTQVESSGAKKVASSLPS